jgi:hypothetical protein
MPWGGGGKRGRDEQIMITTHAARAPENDGSPWFVLRLTIRKDQGEPARDGVARPV